MLNFFGLKMRSPSSSQKHFWTFRSPMVNTCFLGGTRCLFFACICMLFYIFEISISIFPTFFSIFRKQNGTASSTSLSFKISPKCPINFCNKRLENRAKVWSLLKKQLFLYVQCSSAFSQVLLDRFVVP